MKCWRSLCAAILVPLFLALDAGILRAGGGPENVALVYNGRSWSSKTVANFYTHWRSIPDRCVINLDWDPHLVRTDIASFRTKILQPILNNVQQRNLTRQIDYVVYSTDFPYEIDYSAQHQGQFTSGSLTGLTYLAQLVAASSEVPTDQPIYAGLNVNWYASRVGQNLSRGPTRGFRSGYRWSPSGEKVSDTGMSYLLSVMLGYTQERGNSVDEVIRYLQRSVLADGTHPQGTIYLMSNRDVRSTTREDNGGFLSAVNQLQQLGVKAEILEGVVPTQLDDVQGALIGAASFRWETANSRILPGAICEHLTSFGGVFHRRTGQTVLTELLRHGAAGASGTVVEPYALQAKFPHPRIHVHYARGCTLAEAFYQSVFGPYQLLIVGDPLCRPWARIPQVVVRGIQPDREVKGQVPLQPLAITHKDQRIREFFIFLDGQLVQVLNPDTALALDTDSFADGYHELRVVAVEDSPLETQGHIVLPLQFANAGHRISLTIEPEQASCAWDGRLQVHAELPGASHLELYHRQERLGRVAGQRATFQVDPRQTGSGPVTLHVRGILDGQTTKPISSNPIQLYIGFPKDLKPSMAIR